jgi:hypothetical protein
METTICARCGGEMILGQLSSAESESLVISCGTPTSLNPLFAILQGIRGEPDYYEQSFQIYARTCTQCGIVETCLKNEDVQLLARALQALKESK